MKFRNLLIAILLALNTLSLETAKAQPSGQTVSNQCGLATECGATIAGIATGPLTPSSIVSSGSITAGTGLAISGSGTLSLQEATAGTKCMGTVTATGTTAVVVSTTCAKTTSRIFISRSSLPSGTAQCTTQTIVNNTSFELDCDGAETGTFNWIIFNESA